MQTLIARLFNTTNQQVLPNVQRLKTKRPRQVLQVHLTQAGALRWQTARQPLCYLHTNRHTYT